MRYCKHCGAPVSEDAAFCQECGKRVEGFTQVVDNAVITTNYHSDIKERNLVVAIILSIITCGLYGLYWQVKINNEALELAGEKGPSGIVVILLTLITCGIYGYFWYYKMGVCVDKMKTGESGNTGILYIILGFLGLGIVNIALVQDAINNKVNVKF